MAFTLISGARHYLHPPSRTGPLTTPQASRHATDRIVAPPYRALDAGLRPGPFQAEPPACYRASWQLPGPDLHRQATTSLRTRRSTMALRHGVTSCSAGRTERQGQQARISALRSIRRIMSSCSTFTCMRAPWISGYDGRLFGSAERDCLARVRRPATYSIDAATSSNCAARRPKRQGP